MARRHAPASRSSRSRGTRPTGRSGPSGRTPSASSTPAARAATSGFARMPEPVVDRVVRAVEADLASGAWDERHGALRALDAYDAGMRLIVAEPER